LPAADVDCRNGRRKTIAQCAARSLLFLSVAPLRVRRRREEFEMIRQAATSARRLSPRLGAVADLLGSYGTYELLGLERAGRLRG
jgi:hypothetical protein